MVHRVCGLSELELIMVRPNSRNKVLCNLYVDERIDKILLVISDLNCLQLLIAEPLSQCLSTVFMLYLATSRPRPPFRVSRRSKQKVKYIQNAIQEDSRNRTCRGIALGTFVSLQWPGRIPKQI
jgi:hypothetical protein